MSVLRNPTARRIARQTKKSLKRAGKSLGIQPGKGARKQLADKNGEIAALRKQLAHLQGTSQPQSSSTSPVFFVIGQKKSGTTWLMQMLDAHPEILCKGEGRFFGAGWRKEALKDMRILQQPTSLYEAMLSAEDLRLWIERSPWSRDDRAVEHLDNLTRMAVDYFLTQQLVRTGKKMVGDKSPLLTPDTVQEMSRIYPEAKVIHIIRDGRDAVVSATHHVWNFNKGREHPQVVAKRDAYRENPRKLLETEEGIFTGNMLKRVAAEWKSRVGGAVEYGPDCFGDNYIEIKYEDLLERPEEGMKWLLEFLGADAGEESAKRCVNAASFETLTKGRKRGEEVPGAFVRKGVAGDWKNVFTEHNKRVFKEEAGDLLIRLGYEKDEGW